MNGKQLKNSILQWAIQGKLVPPVCRQAGKTLMTNPVPRDKGKECWFTYVIECEDGSFYKGFTDNLLRRYQQHCNGTGADYTKTHKPKQLYYWEMHYSKEAALQREKYLKSGAGREWFKKEVVDKPENFEPASVLLEKIRQEKERLIKEKKIKRDKNASIIYRGEDNSYYEKKLATGEVKCIDEELPFEIPKGWEWVRLNSYSDVRDGTHDTPQYVVSGYPLITSKDFIGGIFDFSKTKYIDERTFIEINKRSNVQIGDILFSMIGGNIGSMILITKENYFDMAIKNVALFKHYIYNDILIKYLYLYLQSQVVSIKNTASGGAQSFVSLNMLRNYLMPIPPLNEQNRIIEKFKSLDFVIQRYKKSYRKLNNLKQELFPKLRKSILQEAIQGKLVPQIAEEGTAQELLKQIKEEKNKLAKEGKLKKSALNDSVIFKGDDNKYYEKIGKKCVNITEEIPFEIPASWTWCHLNDIAESDLGKTMNKGQNAGELVPYLCSINVYWNKIIAVR